MIVSANLKKNFGISQNNSNLCFNIKNPMCKSPHLPFRDRKLPKIKGGAPIMTRRRGFSI